MPYKFDDDGKAICSLCGKKYSRDKISGHYKKCLDAQHRKQTKKSKTDRYKIDRLLRLNKKEVSECMFCRKKIKKSAYYDHVILAHAEEYERYLSKRSKKYKLNRMFGPDEPFNYSRDFFDRYIVVSGGGLGVGRGKK